MIADKTIFKKTEFPKDWDVPRECRGRIVIGGINAQYDEVYYLVDFTQRKIHYCVVSTKSYQSKMVRHSKQLIEKNDLPYGLTRYEDFPINFMQPHEAIVAMGDDMLMAMHNAPYIRIVNFREKYVSALPETEDFVPVMLSATNSVTSDGIMHYTESDMNERFLKYKNEHQQITTRIKSLDLKRKTWTDIGEESTEEVIHECKYHEQSQGIFLTEFCLVTPRKPPFNAGQDVFSHYELWSEYEKAGLYKNKLYFVDTEGKKFQRYSPPGFTPGHLEYSLVDKNIIYLTCHSLSKACGKLILHKTGDLLKYKLNDGELRLDGSYTSEDFYRLTSHKVIKPNLVAITVYPNKIYLFHDPTMEPLRVIELFQHEKIDHERLHFCNLLDHIPLWLDSSSNDRYLLIFSNRYCYIYDIEKDRLRTIANYDVLGEIMITAHIVNIDTRN